MVPNVGGRLVSALLRSGGNGKGAAAFCTAERLPPCDSLSLRQALYRL